MVTVTFFEQQVWTLTKNWTRTWTWIWLLEGDENISDLQGKTGSEKNKKKQTLLLEPPLKMSLKEGLNIKSPTSSFLNC